MKKFFAIIFVAVIALVNSSCNVKTIDYSVLKNPNADYFTCKGTSTNFSSNVWQLFEFNKHLYLGTGDGYNNVGGVPVTYFDLDNENFVTEGELPEEQINYIFTDSNKLIIAGADQADNNIMGSIYILKDGKWVRNKVLPNAIHCRKVLKYNDKYFAVVSTEFGNPILVADEIDSIYEYVTIKDVNGNNINQNLYANHDGINMFILNNNLYAVIGFGDVGNTEYGFYEYDGDSFIYKSESPEFYSCWIYKDKLYYIIQDNNHMVLYSTADLINRIKITGIDCNNVRNAFVQDEYIYVVGSTASRFGFYNCVYISNNGEKFKKIVSLSYPAEAGSIVIASDNNMYIGTGIFHIKDYIKSNANNYGDIIKIENEYY